MAADPVFVGTPKSWAGTLDTANTGRDGTGTVVTIATAGASGSLLERINIKADGNPADSTVVFYLYNGSTYYVWKEIDLGDPAAGSATLATWEAELAVNWPIPTGWSLRASITATPTAGAVDVLVCGGDY